MLNEVEADEVELLARGAAPEEEGQLASNPVVDSRANRLGEAGMGSVTGTRFV